MNRKTVYLKAYPRAAGSMTLHIADIYTAEEFAKQERLKKGNFGKFQQGKTLFSASLVVG